MSQTSSPKPQGDPIRGILASTSREMFRRPAALQPAASRERIFDCPSWSTSDRLPETRADRSELAARGKLSRRPQSPTNFDSTFTYAAW